MNAHYCYLVQIVAHMNSARDYGLINVFTVLVALLDKDCVIWGFTGRLMDY